MKERNVSQVPTIVHGDWHRVLTGREIPAKAGNPPVRNRRQHRICARKVQNRVLEGSPGLTPVEFSTTSGVNASLIF